ncbi:MAG TPA: cysteine desulfurase family protein [Aeromicrobium sp.]|nr:cysteine desulfurase family protein [Aeromicrobium sp.]HKY58169.1 cysteine desulfurase family protein [Aeromicrobium sp.]
MPETTAYLDHAATTPMVPEAIAAFAEHAGRAGNASSLHTAGRNARRVVDDARELIADRLGALPSEVVFTSGGTEANNLALKGFAWAGRAEGRERVIVSAIEHHSVLDPVDWLLDHEGVEVATIPVDRTGLLDLDALNNELADDPASVALVSVMAANNEVGTVQPIAAVVTAAAEHGILVHSDAVQAAGHLRLDFAASGLDAMTVTAHKLGGPIGIGALLLRRELEPVPLLHGGGQERRVRSGTVPTALIASFAAAVDVAAADRTARSARLTALRDRLEAGIRRADPLALVSGADAGPDNRLPSILHVAFPGCEAETLLLMLDAEGVACSAGSACAAGVPQASHVPLAMGLDAATARGSLRFSFGHTSTEADVDTVLAALPPIIERSRAASFLRTGR